MGKLAWYLNRLRAMSPREVLWRIGQKRLQHSEMARFRDQRQVTTPLYPGVEELVARQVKEGVSPMPPGELPLGEKITLPGGFEYGRHATDWHAGLNTDARWPLIPSYTLEYKQRDDIGDARVNWELNRHRQFVGLASEDNLERLGELLEDWSAANPFLWGISWTSPMEIALRSVSWMTAARVIASRHDIADKASPAGSLVRRLLTGAANMTEYLIRHESGFSSANNHLVVEAASVALAGLLFGREDWSAPSLATLDRELLRQVSPDGVDLESSLHYHGFVMEAYLLVWREMAATKTADPRRKETWRDRLGKMARFVAASRVAGERWCVFGDDDEARILAPEGADYFKYLLDLHANVSGEDVLDGDNRQTRVTFPQGGYSFLRGGAMYVGIDHAPLGFGSIAAHGHNDILSFQLFMGNTPVLVDPGTYLYHTDRPRRDLLRSTRMHNTVTIDGMEQSQMLGPFLWGKKAVTRLLSTGDATLTASVKGLSGVTHTRRWDMDHRSLLRLGPDGHAEECMPPMTTLTVTDSFDRPCSWEATFIVAPGIEAMPTPGGRQVRIGGILSLESLAGDLRLETVEIAQGYGRLTRATAIRIIGNSQENVVTLRSL